MLCSTATLEQAARVKLFSAFSQANRSSQKTPVPRIFTENTCVGVSF